MEARSIRIEPASPPADAARVLIVDDSSVARAVIGRILTDTGRFEVAGTASDAASAIALLIRERYDAIILDLELPGTDGLSALPDLLDAGRGAPVFVVSSSVHDGAATSVQAMALGAADTLVKPHVGGLAGAFAQALVERLTKLVASGPDAGVAARTPAPMERSLGAVEIVAIGASTGGIHALGQMLRELPPEFDAPILITQHLPASFMPYFAAQVAVLASRPCDVAEHRMRIRRGRVIIAPGDAHLTCVRMTDGVAIQLARESVASGCMPSVDPMLASVAVCYGAAACGVLLSGMGRDGAVGAAALAAEGGAVLAQDRASSVVWGMPGAVVASGVATLVTTPDRIGRMLARTVQRRC